MENVQLPNNRSFGIVFVVFFSILVSWQWPMKGVTHWAMTWTAAAAAVAVITLAKPDVLTPFNRAWMRPGSFLNRIVSPVALGLMYAILIVLSGLSCARSVALIVKRHSGGVPKTLLNPASMTSRLASFQEEISSSCCVVRTEPPISASERWQRTRHQLG